MPCQARHLRERQEQDTRQAITVEKMSPRHRGACRPSHGAERGEGAEEEAAGGTGRRQKKRNRNRKPRYPKGFDPENPGPPPDPERWLPKYERAEFKKRRKGKGKNQPVSKGAQGMGAVDASLDTSRVKVEDAPAASKPPAARSGGKSGKRKGRR